MSRRSARSSAARRPDTPAAAGEAPVAREPGDPDAAGLPGEDAAGADPAGDTALLGAYALGALTSAERAAVEQRLAASPALQDELRRLIPVAALLREATHAPSQATDSLSPPLPLAAAEPESSAARGADVESAEREVEATRPPAPRGPAPTSDAVPDDSTLRGPAERQSRGLDATPVPGARDDPDPPTLAPPVAAQRRESPLLGGVGYGNVVDVSSDGPSGGESLPVDPTPEPPTVDEAPPVARVEAAPGSLSSRPARQRARAVVAGPRPARGPAAVGSWPLSWIAASLATLIAVGAVLWALALVDRLDARQAEVDALETELSELRARGDAAVVSLAPAESGPAETDGVVVLVPSEGTLIVRVAGLPVSEEGRVYQIWFQGEPDGGWVVGPVFRVGEGGTALAELPVAAPEFARLAISEEPSPGSGEPTGAFLLEGTATQPEATDGE